ncbi:MAG: DUF3107 family protein [Acidimicrobiia bacterium]|nr:DUF3107 family protein [Acidimicrobiia bacterium]
MRVRITMSRSPREVEIDIEDLAGFKVEVSKLFADEKEIWWVTDIKGKELGLPVENIGHIEIDTTERERQVGFA